MSNTSKRKQSQSSATAATTGAVSLKNTVNFSKNTVKNDRSTPKPESSQTLSNPVRRAARHAAINPHQAHTTPAPRTRTQAFAARRKKITNYALDEADDLVFDQVGGFVTFIREHAVVGLAVGFIVGAQAQTVVKQLVTSFIDPVLKLLFGTNLPKAKFTYHGADFTWGAMLYAIINLIFVLAAIYALIKFFKLDKLDKKPETTT